MIIRQAYTSRRHLRPKASAVDAYHVMSTKLSGGGLLLTTEMNNGDVPLDGVAFHDWIDFDGVAHFRDFGGLKILVSGNLRMGIFAVRSCEKVTNIASLIGQRIDFSGVKVLRGQRHILSKNSSYASGISLMIFGSLIMGMIALFCFDRTFV